MDETWVALGISLVSVIFGYALAEYRDWRRGKALEKAVRRLVWLEIEQNLELAEALRSLLHTAGAGAADERGRLLGSARVFVRAPYPTFQHGVWRSQLAAVPRALPREIIHLVFRHYAHLDAIRHAYDQLCRFHTDEQVQLSGPRQTAMQWFGLLADDVMAPCERELDHLIALDNPVRPFLPETVLAQSVRRAHEV